MGAVYSIARRDVLGWMSSPKLGLIFFVFILLMGLFFQSFVYTLADMQQRAPMMGQEAPGVDQLLRALFQNLNFIMVLFVPAISMASFSEEKKNHSIRLLQTSPISSLSIVLGKFGSLVGIVGLVLACTFVYPWFTVAYGEPDIGVIFSSYIGVLLLMASQLAFGLWISSMTSSQFTAFLFTMFGMFLLLILNWIAPNISGGGVAETVVKYIASTSHLEPFLKGMITVADTTYFLCFTALFLFFTNVVIDSQRWR